MRELHAAGTCASELVMEFVMDLQYLLLAQASSITVVELGVSMFCSQTVGCGSIMCN